MEAQDSQGSIIFKWAFWGMAEFLALMAALNWIFDKINAPSNSSVAIGFCALALLVAALLAQVLRLFNRPVEQKSSNTASKAVNKRAAKAAQKRMAKGELLSYDGVSIFVPEGEDPFVDESREEQSVTL